MARIKAGTHAQQRTRQRRLLQRLAPSQRYNTVRTPVTRPTPSQTSRLVHARTQTGYRTVRVQPICDAYDIHMVEQVHRHAKAKEVVQGAEVLDRFTESDTAARTLLLVQRVTEPRPHHRLDGQALKLLTPCRRIAWSLQAFGDATDLFRQGRFPLSSYEKNMELRGAEGYRHLPAFSPHTRSILFDAADKRRQILVQPTLADAARVVESTLVDFLEAYDSHPVVSQVVCAP